MLGIGGVGLNHGLGERGITDTQIIKAVGHVELGKILVSGVLLGIEKLGDAGGYRVKLHCGEPGRALDRIRSKPHEETDPGAGLQHPSSGKAEPLHGPPHLRDDAGRGIVGIQG